MTLVHAIETLHYSLVELVLVLLLHKHPSDVRLGINMVFVYATQRRVWINNGLHVRIVFGLVWFWCGEQQSNNSIANLDLCIYVHDRSDRKT